MYKDLFKLKKLMDMSKYSLRDLALYFESFDGYEIRIVTKNGNIIKFKLNSASFPHLIGIQHIFKNQKDKKENKGTKGLEKIKNETINYNILSRLAKNNNNKNIWINLKDRIIYLPLFLNTLNNRNTKLKIRNNNLIVRQTNIKGKYFIYKSLNDNKYPLISIKELKNKELVVETFIVENDMTLLGTLKEEKIKSIELIPSKNAQLVKN